MADAAKSPEEISNAEVARRFDEWLKDLVSFLQVEGSTQEEHLRLGHLLKVMSHLRPGLVQCYDLPGFPRTNNDMEISIRALKTRYRRISGRKKIGMPICCGMVAVWPTMSGGCSSPMGLPFWKHDYDTHLQDSGGRCDTLPGNVITSR